MSNHSVYAPLRRAASMFRIELTGMYEFDYQGSVTHEDTGQTWAVTGILQMLEVIDAAVKTYSGLQATHKERNWRTPTAGGAKAHKQAEIPEEGAPLATFVLHIQYRQNVTWQGTIEWTQTKKKLFFRSTLELLHLLEKAVGLSQLPSWDQQTQED